MEMPSSSFFDLQIHSDGEADRWILALIQALREKRPDWKLIIVHVEDDMLTFECDPELTNEDVSEAMQQLLAVEPPLTTAKGRSPQR